METQSETTLAKVRLHWGIFIPAFLVVFALPLPVLPMLIFVKTTANMMSQFGQQPAESNSWVLWLVVIPDLLIFGFLFLVTWFAYLKSEIMLTNKRLIFRTGLLSRVSGELPLENVESIFIIEPFIGRLCGYGTVTVTSIGGRAFPLHCVGSPQNFHAALQRAVANAKARGKSVSKPVTPAQDDDSRYMPKF
jgi:hypothetical protein